MRHLDYLFNISADPREEHDLRAERPEMYESMLQLFSDLQKSMVPDAFCGADDTLQATARDMQQHFIAPWIPDPHFLCPGMEKEHAAAHYNAMLCLYNLLPASEC